jgi:hypothetical protein
MKLLWLLFFWFIVFPTQGLFAGEIVVEPPTKLLPHREVSADDTIATIISYGIGLAWVLAVMAVTWAGVQMILAAGDEEKMKKSRNMIIYAFIGVAVAGLAYGIVKILTSVKFDTF